MSSLKFSAGYLLEYLIVRDLFGNEVQTTSIYEEELKSDYEATLQQRIERLKYWTKIYPYGWGMMSTEEYFLLNELKFTFVNGQFVATMLLAQSFIEHWLLGCLQAKGYFINQSPGLKQMIDVMREQSLVHPYIVDKIDELRKVRNPFVHKKSISIRFGWNGDRLSRR